MALNRHKIDNYVKFTEPTCKLINKIPGLRLLISSLPGSALRTHVELLGRPRDSTSILKALPGKLYIKRYSPSILYGPRREKPVFGFFTKNTGADQPAHPRRLISAFVISFLEGIICKLLQVKF